MQVQLGHIIMNSFKTVVTLFPYIGHTWRRISYFQHVKSFVCLSQVNTFFSRAIGTSVGILFCFRRRVIFGLPAQMVIAVNMTVVVIIFSPVANQQSFIRSPEKNSSFTSTLVIFLSIKNTEEYFMLKSWRYYYKLYWV